MFVQIGALTHDLLLSRRCSLFSLVIVQSFGQSYDTYMQSIKYIIFYLGFCYILIRYTLYTFSHSFQNNLGHLKMALLMLRTHDLSWQDHVANIEFMVNPVHNQLLLNKHKTLASKCDQIKKSYDSEMKTKQKNHIIDIRMMERKKRALQIRKSEIRSSKGSRDFSRTDAVPRSGNNNIPKTNIVRGQSAPPNVSSTFMTEVDASPRDADEADDNSLFASPIPRAKTINVWYSATSTHEGIQRPMTQSSIKSSARKKSVRFDDRSTLLGSEHVKKDDIHYKVKLFLDAQKDFNARPLSYMGRYTENVGRVSVQRSTLAAKRYNNTKLDTTTLVNVFDDLCQNRTLDNFKRLSALANRVKTNHKLARNTSVVPAMGTLKSVRRFKEIIQHDDAITAN